MHEIVFFNNFCFLFYFSLISSSQVIICGGDSELSFRYSLTKFTRDTSACGGPMFSSM